MKAYIGSIQIKFSARGIRSYSIEVSHQGLKKHRVIRGLTADFVGSKASFQALEWDEKWKEIKSWRDKKETAQSLTNEAQGEHNCLKLILSQSLSNIPFRLDIFKERIPFQEPEPYPLSEPSRPILKIIPEAPKFIPPVHKKFNYIFNLIPWLKRKEIARRQKIDSDYDKKFSLDYKNWKIEKFHIERENAKLEIEYNTRVKETAMKNEELLVNWSKNRREYLKKQNASNDALDLLQEACKELNPDAIVEFFSMVLNASEYPEYFPKEFRFEYTPSNKILLIDYMLPEPTSIPTLKEVKYIQSRQEFVEQHISSSQHTKLYDDIAYQISLRTIYEIFKADKFEVIQAIVFNGWVSTIDKSTGREIKPCIMSLHVQRNEFMELNLANIDPKLCFKALKGIGSSKLYSLAGIAPIVQSQIHDPRFTESYDVADLLNDTYNLATMDWEDFEHLIRELFEKEFSSSGCEVNVTQASRDGGVDAVIFNPDPIHGGKIVIQAKRYTNPVGVSAVRDLYGTVLNEGANKGILVTTSDFGPDSYTFANGKPLTLFNGGNLLHLLEKHGHKARIDLQEFKRQKT